MNKTCKIAFSSIMAIVLCLSLVVGATYALFTDTATVNVNTIRAGKLDLELQMKDSDGNWVDAEGKTLDFVKAEGGESEEILWEPGCTYNLQDLRLVNKSSLALKYMITVTGISGDEKLNEVIEWTMTYDGNTLETGKELTWIPSESEDDMTKEFVISGHMSIDAGNEYQGLSITNIAITVSATQLTYEHDSVDDQYDSSAILTSAELQKAIENAESGDVIAVAAGTYELPATIGEGVTISGSGADNTTIEIAAEGYDVTSDNVTISNVTIDGTACTSVDYSGAVNLESDNATLENCVVSGGGTGTWGASVAVKVDAGETVYITGTTISGAFRGVFLAGTSGDIVVSDSYIKGTYAINADGGAEGINITVTDSTLNGWTSYGENIGLASFTNVTFEYDDRYDLIRPYADTTFTNCTFNEGWKIYCGATGFTITLNNCTYNGTTVTAENFVSLLVNTSDSDYASLKTCTITVDGVAVTLE